MLKHIKLKDLIEFFLIGVGFMVLILVASILDSAPLGQALWLGVVLALILWIVWFVDVAIERRKNAPRLKILKDGRWIDIESPAGLALLATMRTSPQHPVQVFDQDNPEYKEKA